MMRSLGAIDLDIKRMQFMKTDPSISIFIELGVNVLKSTTVKPLNSGHLRG